MRPARGRVRRARERAAGPPGTRHHRAVRPDRRRQEHPGGGDRPGRRLDHLAPGGAGPHPGDQRGSVGGPAAGGHAGVRRRVVGPAGRRGPRRRGTGRPRAALLRLAQPARPGVRHRRGVDRGLRPAGGRRPQQPQPPVARSRPGHHRPEAGEPLELAARSCQPHRGRVRRHRPGRHPDRRRQLGTGGLRTLRPLPGTGRREQGRRPRPGRPRDPARLVQPARPRGSPRRRAGGRQRRPPAPGPADQQGARRAGGGGQGPRRAGGDAGAAAGGAGRGRHHQVDPDHRPTGRRRGAGWDGAGWDGSGRDGGPRGGARPRRTGRAARRAVRRARDLAGTARRQRGDGPAAAGADGGAGPSR